MPSETILLVEDDMDIREMIRFTLERAGYTTISVETAEEAIGVLEERAPSLAIIDWMLPGMSGLELMKRIRHDDELGNLPLLMLTARGEEADKLKAFDSGVDDYVTKPFSPRELVSRIRALIRRSTGSIEGHITVGKVNIDTLRHSVTVNGAEIDLRPTEYRMLELLMRNPNRAFPRRQLLDLVWGRSVYVHERTVDVHVLRLRKALSEHNLSDFVQTVRGVGYRLGTAPSASSSATT